MSSSNKKSMRSIQIGRIWCMAKELGIDSEHLHLLVHSVTGKQSISILDFSQRCAVIISLEKEQKKRRYRKYRKNMHTKENVTFLPTPSQREKVNQLLDSLKPLINLQSKEAYLNAICKRMYHKEFQKLNRKQVQNIIEALKSILSRYKLQIPEEK